MMLLLAPAPHASPLADFRHPLVLVALIAAAALGWWARQSTWTAVNQADRAWQRLISEVEYWSARILLAALAVGALVFLAGWWRP